MVKTFTFPGAFCVMLCGFPVAMPSMTYEFPAPTSVRPHTSSSSPKSLAKENPSTERHWFVWQCRNTTGAPAMTATPSLTSLFAGSGVSTSNTHS